MVLLRERRRAIVPGVDAEQLRRWAQLGIWGVPIAKRAGGRAPPVAVINRVHPLCACQVGIHRCTIVNGITTPSSLRLRLLLPPRMMLRFRYTVVASSSSRLGATRKVVCHR